MCCGKIERYLSIIFNISDFAMERSRFHSRNLYLGEWVEHGRFGVCRVDTLTDGYVFVVDLSGMSHRVLWGELDAVCFGFDVLRRIGFDWVDMDMGILRIEEEECYVYVDVGRDVGRCRIEMKRGHVGAGVEQWELRCRRLHDMQRWYYRNMGSEMRFRVRK